ncbi:protein kinase-like domain, Phloem protein 2-like protein [Artemisia annua]|uniref:Protein kinase-like domain, Phloem protein 2-like protein n=1 Tax=Artemisia annua TaxID=35608 RepID=A0A2U1PKY3_ARTAN|nr:protein kinase-like domain, Phloem protein 2-like protein [Artemisia annua]
MQDEDDIDGGEYWEKKLPENYQRYIWMSDKPLDYTTKKELYQIFCDGFLADDGKMWFSMCKSTHGICSLLSAIKIIGHRNNYVQDISPFESRFLIIPHISRFKVVKKLNADYHQYFLFKTRLRSVMFSPQYTYACYLLFKFRDINASIILDNTVVLKAECWLDNVSIGGMFVYWSRYTLNIPKIKPKNYQGLHDSSNIPRVEGIGMTNGQMEHLGSTRIEERKDGWMEAMLFKPTNKLQDQENGCLLEIGLVPIDGNVNGMIIEGIEFRPYI